MNYSDHSRFLIQRGVFNKDIKEITGLDSIVTMDYMGAAEYEYGSLPKSLRSIIASYRKGKIKKNIIDILGVSFVLYGNDTVLNIQDIASVLTSLAEGDYKYSVKMGCHLRHYFIGETTTQIKKGCKKKTEIINNPAFCNFWWDIDFDWILIPNEFDYITKMDTALQKLLERNFDK